MMSAQEINQQVADVLGWRAVRISTKGKMQVAGAVPMWNIYDSWDADSPSGSTDLPKACRPKWATRLAVAMSLPIEKEMQKVHISIGACVSVWNEGDPLGWNYAQFTSDLIGDRPLSKVVAETYCLWWLAYHRRKNSNPNKGTK